jgi:hypothetical protein
MASVVTVAAAALERQESSEYRSSGVKSGSLGDRRKLSTIKERVTVDTDSAFATLSAKIPASSRLVWAALHNPDAITVEAANLTGVTSLRLSYVLTDTAPTSLATNVTTDFIQAGAAGTMNTTDRAETIAANSKSRGQPLNAAKEQNTTTSEKTLYIVPYAPTTASSNAQVVNVNTTTPTSGYNFSEGGEVLVTLCVEEFIDTLDE